MNTLIPKTRDRQSGVVTYGNIFTVDRLGLDLLSRPGQFDLYDASVLVVSQQLVGKPWVIAYIHYNDSSLWWVVAKANNVRVPVLMRSTFRIRKGNPYTDSIITDFYLGREVILPTTRSINLYVSKIPTTTLRDT